MLERVTSPRALQGYRLTAVLAALIALSAAAIVVAGAASEDSVRAAIRLTARSSYVLFTLAFTAGSAARFWPGSFTRWLLQSRRYLGLSFAASHAVHGLAILALGALHPLAFVEHTRTTAIEPGLVAYALLAAMAATSSDKAVARLGPRAWKALHLVGGVVIWGGFFKAMLTRTANGAGYWLAVVILIAALALRITAWALPRARAHVRYSDLRGARDPISSTAPRSGADQYEDACEQTTFVAQPHVSISCAGARGHRKMLAARRVPACVGRP